MLTPSIFHLQVLIFLLVWTLDLISIFHSKDGGSVAKTSPAKAAGVHSIPCQEDPWGRKRQPTPVFLAWAIPWTEELGGLQSMGSQELDTTE